MQKNQHVYPKDHHHTPHLTQLTAKNHMVPTLKPCRQHQQCPMCGKPQAPQSIRKDWRQSVKELLSSH